MAFSIPAVVNSPCLINTCRLYDVCSKSTKANEKYTIPYVSNNFFVKALLDCFIFLSLFRVVRAFDVASLLNVFCFLH